MVNVTKGYLFIILALIPCFSLAQNINNKNIYANSYEFQVDSVKPATEPLKPDNIDTLQQYFVGRRFFAAANHPVNKDYLIVNEGHGFLEVLRICYDQHRPLVLSPDDIWFLICQGVNYHLNSDEGAAYRQQLAESDSKREIKIRNDALLSANSNSWQQLIHSFSDSVVKYIKPDYARLLLPHFSTTDSVDFTAFSVQLLESFKESFSYFAMSGCGIPFIRIEGTVHDWQEIESRVESLKGIGLDDWITELKPILGEFIKARKGNPDLEFWKNIYKNGAVYGRFYINGWFVKFFPYVVKKDYPDYDEENYDPVVKEYLMPNPYLQGKKYLYSNLLSSDFSMKSPGVPLKWSIEIPGKQVEIRNMRIKAGFAGAVQNKEELSLSPLITWVVYDEAAPEFEYPHYGKSYERIYDLETAYYPFKWRSKPDSLPVYKPLKNFTYRQGIEALRNDLLENGFNFLPKDSLEISIAWSGDVTEVKSSLSSDKNFELYKFLSSEDRKWQAAYLRNEGKLRPTSGAEMPQSRIVFVNYQLHIGF